MTLPDFNSTKECPACGCMNFVRKYERDVDIVCEIGPHLILICEQCGWTGREKLKCDSEGK